MTPSSEGGGDASGRGDPDSKVSHEGESPLVSEAGTGVAGSVTEAIKKANDSDDSSERPAHELKETNSSSSTPPPPSETKPTESISSLPQHAPLQTAGYYPYHQASPTPPSPTIAASAGGYDIQAMMLQQQAAMAQQHVVAAGNPFGRQQYGAGIPPPPLSPSTNASSNVSGAVAANISMGVVPPASPLLPTTASFLGGSGADQIDSARMPSPLVAPPSPSLPYMSSHAVPNSPVGVSAYGAMYQGYGAAGGGYSAGGPNNRDSPAPISPDQHGGSWPERSPSQQQQPLYHQNPSPHLQSQAPNQMQGGLRSTSDSLSFDEMLPPAAVDRREQGQGTHPQYAGGNIGRQSNFPSSGGGGGGGGGMTLFAHQQPWGGYTDGYGGSHSSTQQHSQAHHHGARHVGGNHSRRGGPPLSGGVQPGGGPSYYTATTPGPPIQTTPSNKGPDGANLFIFHIPNHFTNLDMYQLFCQYGNLLSVRIMVEKDTGRSRGFGFVSYDSPEAAAMAIKELNGLVIGNKRLKVQHKQIRVNDHGGMQHYQHNPPPSAALMGEGGGPHGGMRAQDSQISEGVDTAQKSIDAPKWYTDLSPKEEHENLDEHQVLTEKDESLIERNSQRESKPKTVSRTENESATRRANTLLDAEASSQDGGSNNASGNSDSSPLSHLGSMRAALPDVVRK